MEQNVVIAVDHSAQAEHAVKFYIERVHRPGNKAVLVHCIELPELSINKARDSHMSPSVLANLWKEEEARTKTLEERMRVLLQDKEVPGVLRTATGKPGEVICQIAEDLSAAMIITGTRGVGKVRRTILGSVSDYLVNHAICPVMVCRDPADIDRKRRPSAPDVAKGKSRHASGDSIGSFTASLRQRFASGGKSRSVTSERDEQYRKENRDPKVKSASVTTEEDEDEEAVGGEGCGEHSQQQLKQPQQLEKA